MDQWHSGTNAATHAGLTDVASVAVTAEQPGLAGNLPAGAITGWLDAKLRTMTVTNPAAAAGGTSEEKPAVALSDLEAVTEATGIKKFSLFGVSQVDRIRVKRTHGPDQAGHDRHWMRIAPESVLVQSVGGVIVGVVVYAVLALVLRIEEVKQVAAMVLRRG